MLLPWREDDGEGYLSAWSIALESKFVTMNGAITEVGYKMYLTLLGLTGKSTLHNAPPRKSYVWFLEIDQLKKLGYVEYDEIKYEYKLTSKGNDIAKVLAKSLTNNGVPRI
jgi:hypothetical protein